MFLSQRASDEGAHSLGNCVEVYIQHASKIICAENVWSEELDEEEEEDI